MPNHLPMIYLLKPLSQLSLTPEAEKRLTTFMLSHDIVISPEMEKNRERMDQNPGEHPNSL